MKEMRARDKPLAPRVVYSRPLPSGAIGEEGICTQANRCLNISNICFKFTSPDLLTQLLETLYKQMQTEINRGYYMAARRYEISLRVKIEE